MRRLNSVDLPTFGRPRIATRGSLAMMVARFQSDDRKPERRPSPSMLCFLRRNRKTRSAAQAISHGSPAPLCLPTTCSQGGATGTLSLDCIFLSAFTHMATATHKSTEKTPLEKIFGPRGWLAKNHPQYEYRASQLEMAEEVESALENRRHLIAEAGTGTGKTLAYLVPAILSGRRVVVSTGTKNLQEQIFFKDIPFLRKHLGPLRACYMKGRANYACRQKVYDAEKEPVLEGLEEIADFQIIRDWEKATETGDRAEIKTLPESSSTWAKIDARSDRCTGQKCPQFERCFITRMHQKALESDIIIVNHHLFFADLAVKGNELSGIIPEYGAVIFDEAHEVEEVAGQYFGVSVSSYQFEELIRDISGVAHRKEFSSKELDRVLMTLGDRAQHFLGLFGTAEGRIGFRSHEAFLMKNEEIYRDVLAGLELIALQLELLKAAPEETIPLTHRAREIAHRLEFWMKGDDRRF